MTQQQSALVAGASGLVGSALLQLLLAAPACDRVTAVGRRPLGVTHRKLTETVTDFDNLEAALARGEAADVAFCTLGTTIKKAGSQAAFRKVDHDYVLAFARAAQAAGARSFLLVSAIGADARSAVFYSRVKGETENDVGAIGFESVHLFRPGILLGDREETRLAESVGVALTPLLNPLLLGPFRAYRGIAAGTVARAMAAAANDPRPGRYVHTFNDMQALAASF